MMYVRQRSESGPRRPISGAAPMQARQDLRFGWPPLRTCQKISRVSGLEQVRQSERGEKPQRTLFMTEKARN
jgi:hypothetical protein